MLPARKMFSPQFVGAVTLNSSGVVEQSVLSPLVELDADVEGADEG